jgi:ABC-type lipoprotein export system ATPase subunit
MSDWVVQARGLRKSYTLGRRQLEVLCRVDLEVRKGEFVALRGASGAGKSTLLHLVGALDRADAGELTVAGQLLTGAGTARLTDFRNRQVGFIFQAYHLLPELDAVENVALPARMARMAPAAARARAMELLERVGLRDRLDHRPYELSGGEQQRVAIARSLMNRPPLLLADEPTGNLDSKTGDDILRVLLDLRAETGLTLIIATHDIRVAGRAERTVVLADGNLVPSGQTVSHFDPTAPTDDC